MSALSSHLNAWGFLITGVGLVAFFSFDTAEEGAWLAIGIGLVMTAVGVWRVHGLLFGSRRRAQE